MDSYDYVIKYIKQKKDNNEYIDPDYIFIELESCDIDYASKCKILAELKTYNVSIIKGIQHENYELGTAKFEPDKDTKINTNNRFSTLDTENKQAPSISYKRLNVASILKLIIESNDLSNIKSLIMSHIKKEDFDDTIKLLIAGILSEVTSIKKLKNEEYLSNGNNCTVFDAELNKLNSILNVLFEIQYEDVMKPNEEDNTIIYLPTIYGNINISNDLKDVPLEFYDVFYNLFKSIKNGSFKNFKRITGDYKTTILEVKDGYARVLFTQIESNIYLVSTLFVKKMQTSKYYLEHLREIDSLVYDQLQHIKAQLLSNREEFINYNDSITKNLLSKLLTKDKEMRIDEGINIKTRK